MSSLASDIELIMQNVVQGAYDTEGNLYKMYTKVLSVPPDAVPSISAPKYPLTSQNVLLLEREIQKYTDDVAAIRSLALNAEQRFLELASDMNSPRIDTNIGGFDATLTKLAKFITDDVEKDDPATAGKQYYGYQSHIKAARPFQTKINDAFAEAPEYGAPTLPVVAKYVGDELATETALIEGLSDVALPDFCRDAFAAQMARRSGLVTDAAIASVRFEESVIDTTVLASIDKLLYKKRIDRIDAIFAGGDRVLRSRVKSYLPRVLLSPDEFLRLWESSTKLALDYGAERRLKFQETVLGGRLELMDGTWGGFNKLVDELWGLNVQTYQLVEKLVQAQLDANNSIQSTWGSLGASISASAYGAIRTQFQLSEKAFTGDA